TALIVTLMCFGKIATAASFDCNKASGYIELTICTTPALSSLDEQLNVLYKKVNQSKPESVQLIKKSQLSWLKDVRNKATTAQGLTDAYTARINDLNMMLGNVNTVQAQQSTPTQAPIQQTSPKQSQQSQQQERTKEPSKLVQNSIQPPQPLKSETHTPQAVELSQKEMDSIRIKLNESMSELQANPRIVSYFCYRYDSYPDYNRRNGIIQAASHLLDGKAQMDGEVIIQNIVNLNELYSKSLPSDFNAAAVDLRTMCTNLSNFAYKKGWAVN
ncbi:TPA: DUF1311 domain-containing protein, partial [Raoultella ornithinolytica]|nr:DUF1311 domain-containing protein [Raoultella ornithinolytica]HAV2054692.1 DUF1311 domain-containing protein [Raoultella ornithinolytica]